MCIRDSLIAAFDPGFDRQLFHADLLLHQALLELWDGALADALIAVRANDAGNFNHGRAVKVLDGAFVGHDQ